MMMLKRKSTTTLLENVQKATILKDATRANLYNLLLLSDPTLSIEDVDNSHSRLKVMRQLMIKIHPNNFPRNPDAPSIYEDVQTFYDACCKALSKKKEATMEDSSHRKRRRQGGGSSPTTVVDSVVQFNVRQKWPYLDGYTRPVSPLSLTSGKILAPLIAYQCINARGAIAHGKKPSLIYSWENVSACNGLSVQDVFDKHGGTRSISKVEDIKVEIIQNGPVASVTFIPNPDFAAKYEDSIVTSRIKKRHYCIIIGWKLTEFGEVWLVQNYAGNQIMEVPFGQHQIEESIIVPKDSLLNTTWQKGPYFDMDMASTKGWLQLRHVDFYLKSSEFEVFMTEALRGKGIYEAITNKTRFVLRDMKKMAHSRTCNLQEVKWDKKQSMWFLACVFTDGGAKPHH